MAGFFTLVTNVYICTMKKFTEIEQLRSVVKFVRERHDYGGKDESGKAIYKNVSPYPTITFTGTVKLHGTNAAIVKYADGSIRFQSRERELSLDSDNAGFMARFNAVDFSPLFSKFEFTESCAIYGEWCGGNIQQKVALSQLEKMFVIFAVKADDKYIQLNDNIHLPSAGIYNILNFPTFSVDIDFNSPETVQNKLVEITESVEAECPFAKVFGVSGIGEGVVYSAFWNNEYLTFKVKGEKHQSSKIKKLATVDTEKMESVAAFVDYAVTESRLDQGFTKLREMGFEISEKSMGEYLRWLMTDIVKEESDTLEKSGLTIKECQQKIVAIARRYFLSNLVNYA